MYVLEIQIEALRFVWILWALSPFGEMHSCSITENARLKSDKFRLRLKQQKNQKIILYLFIV
jgi:hypothetical protein